MATATQTQYGQHKRPTTSQPKPQPRKPQHTPISASELERAQQAKADWQTHFGDTAGKDLIKDLYNAGLIDGWRNVSVTETVIPK